MHSHAGAWEREEVEHVRHNTCLAAPYSQSACLLIHGACSEGVRLTGSHGPPWESVSRVLLAPVYITTLACGNEIKLKKGHSK